MKWLFFGKEKQDWLRQFSDYQYGTPFHETLRYFLCAMNPADLIQSFQKFVASMNCHFEEDVIGIDGKTIKGSGHYDHTDPVHVISAWSNTHGITLAALESQGKKK